MADTESLDFKDLGASGKKLIRKLGETPEHKIVVQSGNPGKGWEDLYQKGWIRIRDESYFGGYTVVFTLDGWEAWGRQVDLEENNKT